MVIALFSAAFAIPAAAQCVIAGENTFCGTVAGAGATGSFDSGFGFAALASGDSGGINTATGGSALYSNTTGAYNTATGYAALYSNTTGADNTATGEDALINNTTGGLNIAVGFEAGEKLTTGDNNIDIGNGGVAAESDTIRIGMEGTQTATYIAGIATTAKIKKGCEVVVESSGLIGCVKSSMRYKRDIRDMGDASDKLMKLRPVTFRYKTDPTGARQYGLIAEEVEQVYPELVIDDAQGKADTVAYQMLPAMLLNEVQKVTRENKRKDARIAALQKQIAAQQGQIDALTKKDAQINALVERVNALEGQVRLSVPQRLAAVGEDSAPRLR
ncbi:MAG: tail fiber domain-containing protein [Candidatus Binataceae bacterium]